MSSLPFNRKEFGKRWPKFRDWLLANGSAIYEPTNPYEVARFLTDKGIGIVYANGSDRITNWVNGASEAFTCFSSSKSWRATEKTKHRRRDRDYLAIVARDGDSCMYCLATLSEEAATIEHIIPLTCGGPNHLSNKALACRNCNSAAGHLSGRQKIELAISRRMS